MIVDSPIGQLPFTPKRLHIRDGAFRLKGYMGAWPAEVQISLKDIFLILKVLVVGLVTSAVPPLSRRARREPASS